MSLNEAYKDKLTDQTFHCFKRKTLIFPLWEMIPSSARVHSVLKNSLTWEREEKKEAVNIAKRPRPEQLLFFPFF